MKFLVIDLISISTESNFVCFTAVRLKTRYKPGNLELNSMVSFQTDREECRPTKCIKEMLHKFSFCSLNNITVTVKRKKN